MISDTNINCKFSDIDYFEGMTSISAVINSIISGDSDRIIFKIYYDKTRADKKAREISYLSAMSARLDFELIPSTPEELAEVTSGSTSGGFIAVCSKRYLPELDALKTRLSLGEGGFYALLDGIEDPYNFGYSLRSLYAAGADGVILPPRNWLEFSSTVARSSAGASELSKIYVGDPIDAVEIFKSHGFCIACAGIRDSVSLYEADLSGPTLLIVGGEKRGISRKLLDTCDLTVRINYGRDFKGPLPTAAAVSVIAFEAAKQQGKLKN